MLIFKKVFLYFSLLYFLLYSNAFSLEVFLPVRLVNKLTNDTITIYFLGGFSCSLDNCSNFKPLKVKIYDFEKVKKCFYKYNINNIHSCIKTYQLPPFFKVKNNKPLILVLNTNIKPSKLIYFIFSSPKTPMANAFLFLKRSTTNPTIKYLNVVYDFLRHPKSSLKEISLVFKPVIFNKIVLLKGFSIQNTISPQLPLLTNIPTKISIQFFNIIISRFPIPQYIKTLGSIPIKVNLQIFHKNKLVFEKTEIVYQTPTSKSILNFYWTPQQQGLYLLRLKLTVNSSALQEKNPTIVEKKIKVLPLTNTSIKQYLLNTDIK